MPTLDWIGKKAVVNHHREVPYRLLNCDKSQSVGDPDAGNLLVQGDNLEALKALLPYYAGKVKCIYIDPPYNTGNENWVYNDNVNSPEIKAWLGAVVGKEAEDLSRHDKWLCMMYPRLRLLKEFLHDDGSIWVSIDDTEVSSLRAIMDEIFGRTNFIASNIWQKRYSRENREAIGDVHEYILVYASDPERFKATRNLIGLTEDQAKIYKNANDDPRGRWRGIPMTAQGYRPNQMYKIATPSGAVHSPPEGRCWSMVEAEFKKLEAEGRIYFGKDGSAQPSVIRYLSEVEGFVPWTLWTHDEVGHTDEAKKEIREIFGTQTAFDTPKPTRLIERVIQIATSEGDLVLDSFAGSGTTGHAAFRVNNLDGKNRRFILVEMEEKIALDVTAKRLRHAASESFPTDQVSDQEKATNNGFRFCILGEPLFDADGNVSPAVTYADLAAHVFFCETGSPIPRRADGTTSLIGTFQGRAIYLLHAADSIGVASPNAGNVLTVGMLEALPLPEAGFTDARIVYAEGCTVPDDRLNGLGVTFKQVPYQIEGL
jgi:site-specific DNA-methyltransferase (adenine-specific)/adenine-specific DNA-methyltransferase